MCDFREKNGYVVVEASYILPIASILILLTIWLGSYLYQSCYLVQSAYIAAFRGSRQSACSEAWVDAQLDELLAGQVLSFGSEERQIEAGTLSVSVTLVRKSPLPQIGESRTECAASWKVAVRDPAAWIRGLRRGKELVEKHE